MTTMRTGAVVTMSEHGERSRRVRRAMAARRLLRDTDEAVGRRHAPRTGGRLWLNGAELGGTDPRHAHLAASFD